VVVYHENFVTAQAKMSTNANSISSKVIQQVVRLKVAVSVNIRQFFLFGEKLSMRIKVVRIRFLRTKKYVVLFQQLEQALGLRRISQSDDTIKSSL